MTYFSKLACYLGIIACLLPVLCFCSATDANTAGEIDILTVVPKRWGANTFFNMDDYLRHGWNVSFAGLSETVPPCNGFDRLTGVTDFTVDMLIDGSIDPRNYDAMIFGPATSTGPDPYSTLLNSPETLTMIQNATNFNCFVWSTCAGLRLFAAADIINGRDVVGNDRFVDEYTAAGANWLGDDLPPARDDLVLTTVRGMYYHHHLNDFTARAIEQSVPWSGGLMERGFLPVTTTTLTWPDTTWAYAIGTDAAEDVRDIQPVGSDGTIMAGFTWAEHMCDALLIRTDADGTVRWARTFGGDGTEYGNSVCVMPDGNFLLAGYTTSTTTDGNRDILLVCVDANGTEQWTHTLGGDGLDVARCVRPVSSGGYILCGHTESAGNGEDDIYLVRLDANGDTLWTQTFGGNRAEVGYSVCELPNGDFMVAGSNGTDGKDGLGDPMSQGNMDYYLIRTDSQGNELWWHTYGNDTGEGFDYCYNAIATSDGGFLMTGSADASFPLDAVQIKTDATGTRQWFKPQGSTFYDYGTSAMEISDGYMITAVTRTPTHWPTDLYLFRTDFNGDLVSSWTIGGTGPEWINASCMGPDGSIIVAGQTTSAGAGKSDVVIARIDLPNNNTLTTKIAMPATQFTAGDPFKIDVRFWNPALTPATDAPLFVILDVYGELFFWPGWTTTPDFATVTIPPGASSTNIIPEFAWPTGTGSATGIGLYAALTNTEMSALFGEMDYVEFGWW